MAIETIIKSILSFPGILTLSFNKLVLFEMFGDSVGFFWTVSLIDMSIFFKLLEESATEDIN